MGIFHKVGTGIREGKIVVRNFKKRKVSLDLSKKFYIAGIEKCGSTSLEKYLVDKGFNIVREESNYCRSFGVKKYKLQYPDYQTLFIIREPIERIWSHYNYKRYYQDGDRREIKSSFEESITKHPEMINASNYEKWLKKWESTNPVVIKLEDLEKQSDFPRKNTTKKSSLTETQKNDIINSCKKLGFDPTNYQKFEYTPIETILNP